MMTKITNKVTKYGPRTALILLLAWAVFVLATWPHWWWRVWSARVLIDGRPAETGNVYRSYDGRYLVSVPGPHESASQYRHAHFYTVPGYASALDVVSCQSMPELIVSLATLAGGKNDFWLLPGAMASRDIPPRGRPTYHSKVEGPDPKVERSADGLSFTDLDQSRITVQW